MIWTVVYGVHSYVERMSCDGIRGLCKKKRKKKTKSKIKSEKSLDLRSNCMLILE